MSRLYEALEKANPIETDVFRLTASATRPAARLGEVGTELTELDEVPTLRIPTVAKNRLVVLWDERSAGAEQIRILAMRLRQLQQVRKLKKVLITSGVKNEGKSVIAANLAINLARHGSQRVLLVDGDTRQPMLDDMLGLSAQPGLVDAWQDHRATAGLLRRCEGFPMWFLPAGRALEQPLQMLQSESLPKMMSEFNGCFDWVIIDSPPVVPLADSRVWATVCDGVLLVVRAGKTPKKVLAAATASIEKGKLVGVVLNDCAGSSHSYYTDYKRAS